MRAGAGSAQRACPRPSAWVGSVTLGFRHDQAVSLGVILLWPWPWRSLAASETKKANRNAVQVRPREERSDETFNKSSRDSGHLFFDA